MRHKPAAGSPLRLAVDPARRVQQALAQVIKGGTLT